MQPPDSKGPDLLLKKMPSDSIVRAVAAQVTAMLWRNSQILHLCCLGVGLTATLPLSPAEGVKYTWVYANPRYAVDHLNATWSKGALDYTHMGMLALLPNGTLAAAWQGAPVFWEGSNVQGIHLATSPDLGLTWGSSEEIVTPSAGVPIWAPVLHTEGNKTWLFYAESRPQCTWIGEGGLHWGCGGDLKMSVSDDSATTWSPPQAGLTQQQEKHAMLSFVQLIASFDAEGGIAKMVANKLVVTPDKTWLLPFWRERGGDNCTQAPGMHGKAGVLISSNQGASWKITEVALEQSSPATWLIEASISGYWPGPAEDSKKKFLQIFRTQLGTTYISFSDTGEVWSDAKATSLSNPNSKVDSLSLPDGRVLVAFNDDPVKRTKLTLAVSSDGGQTWKKQVVLEDDPDGSFSYPTLQLLPEKKEVVVIYSVAFPPGHKPSLQQDCKIGGKPLSLASPKCWSHFKAWRGWFGGRRRRSTARTQGETSPGSRNAWGLNAYGLKLAIVDMTRLEL